MRDDDEFVNADAGYVGIQKRQELASDAHLSKVEWGVSERSMKVRYRGLGKNGGRLRMLFGLANISRWSWRQDSLSALATARQGSRQGISAQTLAISRMIFLVSSERISFTVSGNLSVPGG